MPGRNTSNADLQTKHSITPLSVCFINQCICRKADPPRQPRDPVSLITAFLSMGSKPFLPNSNLLQEVERYQFIYSTWLRPHISMHRWPSVVLCSSLILQTHPNWEPGKEPGRKGAEGAVVVVVVVIVSQLFFWYCDKTPWQGTPHRGKDLFSL